MVTGANGFVAQHVIAELARRGSEVMAIGRQDEPAPSTSLANEYIGCDLTDQAAVDKLPLGEVDAVINLAGLAAVGESFSQRDRYLAVNVGVNKTVCDVAARRGLRDLRVIAVSSGAVYAGGQAMPLSEFSAVDPTSSPYAESKLAMEENARAYRGAGVDCLIVRPFNHIGPGQGPGFLLPDLLREAQRARTDGEPMRVGNLSTRRDYTDVRDVAAAYVDLAAAVDLKGDLYNVCTGRSLSGVEILRLLLDAMGSPDLEVEIDQTKFRPSDQPDIVGNSDRLNASAGWVPVVPVERSISDFVAAAQSN